MSVLDNVSRETISDIEKYEGLVRKWSPKINLVAKSTLPEIRTRHVLDSAHLMPLVPDTARLLVDIGSGGGMPGLVLAIIAKEKRPDLSFKLIESDQRKAAFLRTVSIELELNAEILVGRIEEVASAGADVLTARALAPLPKLLKYVARHLQPDGVSLLQKGVGYAEEVALAQKLWDFDLKVVPYAEGSSSVALRITKLREKHENES